MYVYVGLFLAVPGALAVDGIVKGDGATLGAAGFLMGLVASVIGVLAPLQRRRGRRRRYRLQANAGADALFAAPANPCRSGRVGIGSKRAGVLVIRPRSLEFSSASSAAETSIPLSEIKRVRIRPINFFTGVVDVETLDCAAHSWSIPWWREFGACIARS
jgi:hypothetical protein